MDESLKNRIIKAIKSDAEARSTLEILNSGHLGAILRRYEDEYRRTTGKEVKDDHILTRVFAFNPQGIKKALQVWVSADIWRLLRDDDGKLSDEHDFNISFHEALDELELSRALQGEGFERRAERPLPLPKLENFNPRRTPQL